MLGRTRRSTPQGVNLEPGDTMEMSCKADRAFPSPTITWYLGPSNPVNFNSPKFKDIIELINENGPSSTGDTFSSSQTVRYTARMEDNQISVYCETNQVDDESNEERTPSSQRFTLYVRPAPLPRQAPVNTCKWTEWSPSCEPFCNVDGSTKEGVPQKRRRTLVPKDEASAELCDAKPVVEVCEPCTSEYN